MLLCETSVDNRKILSGPLPQSEYVPVIITLFIVMRGILKVKELCGSLFLRKKMSKVYMLEI